MNNLNILCTTEPDIKLIIGYIALGTTILSFLTAACVLVTKFTHMSETLETNRSKKSGSEKSVASRHSRKHPVLAYMPVVLITFVGILFMTGLAQMPGGAAIVALCNIFIPLFLMMPLLFSTALYLEKLSAYVHSENSKNLDLMQKIIATLKDHSDKDSKTNQTIPFSGFDDIGFQDEKKIDQ
jgi:hypothetical protein